jgi:peroxiredoxin Q/BCP
VGVSKDDTDSHKRFVEKYTLPFPLLADTDCAMIRSYGADGVTYPKRVSFLIDAKGIIAKVYETVMCEEHAREVILDLQEMSGTV